MRLEEIARDHKLSYYRTIEIVYGAVKKLENTVSRIQENQSGASPARKGRSAVTSRVRDFSPSNVIPFDRRKGRPANSKVTDAL